ncbi:MAG: anthranilate synthase component I [Anaerolineales bacterium]
MVIKSENHQMQLMVRELPADLETPISIYLKLKGNGASFLLESVCGGEQVARYSFIGIQPTRAFVLRDDVFNEIGSTYTITHPLHGMDPLRFLQAIMPPVSDFHHPNLPRFKGGLVGYLSYEMVRYFEPSLNLIPHPTLPEAIFFQADTLIAFDHAFNKLIILSNIPQDSPDDSAVMHQFELLVQEIEHKLYQPLPPENISSRMVPEISATQSNMSEDDFIQSVLKAKEHILDGDIFQVVLSQRFERTSYANPFEIYRTLRQLNPSPYMFFFDFDKLAGEPNLFLIGASPEMHVRFDQQKAIIRPIAGTRRRGITPQEDEVLAQELLNDAKERAEHIMLVDLARNDLGRTCEIGSVRVSELMGIERYSHVMHIVSQVEGQLATQYNAFDLLRTTFPAGTVSGAPKIRAMQIIQDLEKTPRGLYAGAVGYISFDGTMDTCINIRSLIVQGNKVSFQSGAGIVADSDPQMEYQETLNKARAMEQTIILAENHQTGENNVDRYR